MSSYVTILHFLGTLYWDLKYPTLKEQKNKLSPLYNLKLYLYKSFWGILCWVVNHQALKEQKTKLSWLYNLKLYLYKSCQLCRKVLMRKKSTNYTNITKKRKKESFSFVNFLLNCQLFMILYTILYDMGVYTRNEF